MSSAFGPREYIVEPERPLRRRKLRMAAGTLAVLAVGGAAFGIASALSTSASPQASASTHRNAPDGTHPPAGGPFGDIGGRPLIRGIVRTVGTAAFTVTARDGTVTTIAVNSATVFRSLSGATERLSDLRSGEGVAVSEVPNSSPVVAESVVVVPSGSFGPRGGFGGGRFGAANATFGVVGSVGSSSFTITARTFPRTPGTAVNPSTLTVVVTSSTRFDQRGGGTASLTNLAPGDAVAVIGTRSGSTVRATTVTVLRRLRGAFGQSPAGAPANA